MDVLVGVLVVAAVGVGVIAEVVVGGSGLHFIGPGIRQTAGGGDHAGQHLRHTGVAGQAGQADPQSGVHVAFHADAGVGHRVDKAAFNGHRGVDQHDHVLVVGLYIVQQGQLHVLQFQVGFARVAAVGFGHVHDGVGALAAGPAEHHDGGVGVALAAVQQLIAVHLQRLLHDVVAGAGHIGHAAFLAGVLGVVVNIELPQIRVYGDALGRQRVLQVQAAFGIPVPAAGGTGAQIQLLVRAGAEQVYLPGDGQQIPVVLQQNGALGVDFGGNGLGFGLYRFQIQLLGFGRGAEIQVDHVGIGIAQYVHGHDGAHQNQDQHRAQDTPGLAFLVHACLLMPDCSR